jgi:hypothetical protein
LADRVLFAFLKSRIRKKCLPERLRVDFRFDSVEKVLATGDRTFVKAPLGPYFRKSTIGPLLNLEQKIDLASKENLT